MNNLPEEKYKADFSFRKEEHLCSKKIIEKLFSEGSSFLAYPIKVVYLPVSFQDGTIAKVAFTASKKIFKKAVLRNLIKRRMREAYRLNKNILQENKPDKGVAFFFIFIGKEASDFKTIELAVKKSLKRISKETITKNESGI